MARSAINRGTTAGDGTGETAFSAFGKVNDNFIELYTGFIGKNNVTTTDPGAANDNTQSYAVGSTWYNSSTGVIWFARSVATGAAVWIPTAGATLGRASARWYAGTAVQLSSGGLGANLMFATPIYFDKLTTIDQIGVRVATGVASTNVVFAIYSDNNGRPGTKLHEGSAAQSTATSGTNAIASFTVNPVLERGWYWLVSLYNGGSNTGVFTPSGGHNMAQLLGTSVFEDNAQATGVTGAATYPTFPTSFGTATIRTANSPAVQVRIA